MPGLPCFLLKGFKCVSGSWDQNSWRGWGSGGWSSLRRGQRSSLEGQEEPGQASSGREGCGEKSAQRKSLGNTWGEGEKTGVVGARDPEGSWTRIWKHSERYIVVSGCFQLLLTETPAKSGLNSAGLDWLMFGKSWHPKAASGKARSRVQRPQQQPYISTFPFFS